MRWRLHRTLAAVLVSACFPLSLSAQPGTKLTLTIAPAASGAGTPRDFLGLSFETAATGVYHLRTYSKDEPFKRGSRTLPRTEQRFLPDYTGGEVQYQAMLRGDPAENSYCIFQIHTGNAQSRQYGSTTFMLFWFGSDGGSVHDYSRTELASHLGSEWFRLNVNHNLVTRTITVWINGKQVWQQRDSGAGDFYMKDGVYEQHHGPTARMDAWVKEIHFWTSPGAPHRRISVVRHSLLRPHSQGR
jgi:hypothetical protein